MECNPPKPMLTAQGSSKGLTQSLIPQALGNSTGGGLGNLQEAKRLLCEQRWGTQGLEVRKTCSFRRGIALQRQREPSLYKGNRRKCPRDKKTVKDVGDRLSLNRAQDWGNQTTKDLDSEKGGEERMKSPAVPLAVHSEQGKRERPLAVGTCGSKGDPVTLGPSCTGLKGGVQRRQFWTAQIGQRGNEAKPPSSEERETSW